MCTGTIPYYLPNFEAEELKRKIFNLFECVIADHLLGSHSHTVFYLKYVRSVSDM